ncbi:MAG TPA: M1 family metallopeptidase [Jatrophihabitans sp.]|nr:M1 family metallopeptidase [Jatrophihabitans sp.]
MDHAVTRHNGDAPTHGASTAGDPYLPDSGNGGYRVTRYELDLTYRTSSNLLLAVARLYAVATQSLSRFSLDLAGLRVSKVSVNGRRAQRFRTRGRKLHVWPDKPLPVGATITIDIHYSGNPRPVRGRWGEVGWDELTDGALVASQPDGAPTWFPCNDHPSNKASYQITVTTDSPYHAVANGSLRKHTVRGSQTTWVYDQPEPMATYLATVQIGQYELVNVAKKPVRQQAALPPRHRDRFSQRFNRQPAMMPVFENLFGAFPFPQYTTVIVDDDLEIPLEAQGMSIFGADFLDELGDERLIAHELAHQWFGNSLTADSWQHIWLHEGFACYAEWLWSEESGGPAADQLAARHQTALADLPQDFLIADPGPDLMFDDRLYKRGALTLHALRRTVGDDAFFTLLRGWTATHRHGSVNTRQFIAHAEQHAAEPLRDLFTAWLYEPALPTLPTARRRR